MKIGDRLDGLADIGPIPPRGHWDWFLAAAMVLAAVALLIFDRTLPLWAQIVPSALAVAFVPFRRQIPAHAVVTVSVVAAACVLFAVQGSEISDVGSPAGPAEVVLLYALFRWTRPRQAAIGLIVSIACEAIISGASDGIEVDDWPELLPWFVLAGFALAMRYRARAIESRFEQVRLAERNELARELHDIVAHHVSAIAVQAQAGQYVVDSDPGAAAQALRSIETIANESIDEMRRMVGILRSEDDVTRSVAPATLEVLAVQEGQPAVHINGDIRLDELPAGVAAALFRIAQESITNARRHSRGVTFVDVAVEREQDRVHMTVDNDGTPTTRNSGSGYGQVGMQERVEALGGAFESAARPSIGWRTSTSIPLPRIDR